jgi:type IV secretory pathway TrbL component
MIGQPNPENIQGNLQAIRSDDASLKDKAMLLADSSQEMSPGLRGSDIAKVPGGKMIAGKAVGHYTGTGAAGEKATGLAIDTDVKVSERAAELREGGRPQLSSMDTDAATHGLEDAQQLQQAQQVEHENDHRLGM